MTACKAHTVLPGTFHSHVLVLLCLMPVMAAFTGCSEPCQREVFIKSNDRDGTTAYTFPLDMSDSLCRYDISFYTRIDCDGESFSAMPPAIALEITCISPSGQKYAETVSIPKDSFIDESHFSKEYKVPYRAGLIPVENGIWEMSVTVMDEKEFPGLRGWGTITRKIPKTRG